MPTYTQEQLQKRYETLPDDLKKAIFSVETADIIQKISKKYNLQIDKMGELASETGLLMLGFTFPKDYIKNLSARLGTDIETAKKIAQEINAEIFAPVKEHLKKLHGVGEEIAMKEPSSLSAPPTQQPSTEQSPAPALPLPPLPSVTPVDLTQKHLSPSFPRNMTPREKEFETAAEMPRQDDRVLRKAEDKPEEISEKKTETRDFMFQEKVQDKPFRQPSQKTEIKEDEVPATATPEKNREKDPYREPLE